MPHYNQNSLCNKTTHSAAEEPAAPLHGPRKHSRLDSGRRKEKERVRLGEIEAAEVITTREFAHREGERGTIANSAVSLKSSEGALLAEKSKVRSGEGGTN